MKNEFIIFFIVLVFIVFFQDFLKMAIKYYRYRHYIDKDVCFKIMGEVDDVCRKHGVRYYFSEGTALGIYRSGDLIDWDDDVDIGMDEKNFDIFMKKCVTELKDKGFIVVNTWVPVLNGYLFALMKDWHILDVERVKTGEKCISKLGRMCDELIPHIQKLTKRKWRGRDWPVPEESYYEYLYGKDWKVPRKTKNQNV